MGERSVWRRVLELFAPYRTRVAVVVGLVLVTSALGVVNPLLIQRVFDDALFPPSGAPDLGLLTTITVIMMSLALLAGALGVWQTVITNRLGQDVLRNLRDRVYAHLQSLSLRFYASARTGELQSRIQSDVGGVQTAVTSTLTSILSNLVTFLSALVAMAILSVGLTLVSIGAVPLFVAATRAVGRRRERLTRETQEATADMSSITQETLSVSGVTLARLFGRQEWEIDRFTGSNQTLSDVSARRQVIGQAFFSVVTTFLGAVPVVVYLVAGILIEGGSQLTAGTVVAFTTLQTRLFFPVARLLETVVELQSSRAMFRRIFEYLDIEPDILQADNAVDLPADTSGELRFDDVEFEYEPEVPALHRVSFRASPGTLVAFVGPSGAGKSTILSLAARLYDPTGGSVTIDGLDLRRLTFASLARTVGFVTQESYLFADSLGANIAYAKPDSSFSEIEKAARAAAIHERIMEFEAGYDTVVGERGFRLSGGERQRIAIARVLLHDPRLLLLDEATSSLDTASERRIQAALDELISGRTTLAVAHRLSTIQAADVIHVVDGGAIIESGTHEELLRIDGLYRDLYREQFGDGMIEARCSDGVVYTDGHCEYR